MGANVSTWAGYRERSNVRGIARPPIVQTWTLMGYWFLATNQAWKVRIFLGLCLMTVIVVAFSLMSDVSRTSSGLLSGAAVMSASVTLVWVCLAIRCPHCRGEPIWFMIRSVDAGDWFTSVLRLDRCPIYGDRPR